MSKIKIIYFIDGFSPSDDERLDAESFGVHTVFRNSQYVYDAKEACDAVAGALIPEPYANFPRADEFLVEHSERQAEAKQRLAERVAGVSDTPPNKTQNGENAQPVTGWGANK